MLQGKNVLLGVTGGIACYKAAELASALVKEHCSVHVVMTENATKFMTPLTFQTLTGNPVYTDTFLDKDPNEVTHIALAEKADLVLVAPATANSLAKLANGMADDMLTTTVLACTCLKIAAPAMNTHMYENPVTQDNLDRLRHYGWEIIAPASGRLACGAVGPGKLPDPSLLLEAVLHAISHERDMEGLHLLVTAGPTQEPLDPVRYLTNHSTGKMGYAIARAAAARGAAVTLVTGPTECPTPSYVHTIPVTTAAEMFEVITANCDAQDIIIKAAAVADYRPETVADEKIKKSGDEDALSLPLARTQDILSWLGQRKKEGQFLCGFSMETQDLLENSRKKLEKKQLDMIAANNLRDPGAGFGTETNRLTLLTKDGAEPLELLSKLQAAHRLLDAIQKKRAGK